MPTRRRHVYLGWALMISWAVAAVACGGRRGGGADDPSSSAHGDGHEAGPGGPASGPGDEPSVESYCEDGTCFACGEGICPSGYYCDGSGEPACSWLPECASEPSCECIIKRLGAGCSCDERAGGLFVSCD